MKFAHWLARLIEEFRYARDLYREEFHTADNVLVILRTKTEIIDEILATPGGTVDITLTSDSEVEWYTKRLGTARD